MLPQRWDRIHPMHELTVFTWRKECWKGAGGAINRYPAFTRLQLWMLPDIANRVDVCVRYPRTVEPLGDLFSTQTLKHRHYRGPQLFAIR
ncbi:hypothetical protein D3C75_1059890 [compost metagenome]